MTFGGPFQPAPFCDSVACVWLYKEYTDGPDVHIKPMQKFYLFFCGNK